MIDFIFGLFCGFILGWGACLWKNDRNDKLVAAAKQVIDEIEPHGHWHCVDTLKKALEE